VFVDNVDSELAFAVAVVLVAFVHRDIKSDHDQLEVATTFYILGILQDLDSGV